MLICRVVVKPAARDVLLFLFWVFHFLHLKDKRHFQVVHSVYSSDIMNNNTVTQCCLCCSPAIQNSSLHAGPGMLPACAAIR